MHTKLPEKGFTLFEVLVAAFIFSLASAVLMQQLSQAMSYLKRSEKRFWEGLDVSSAAFYALFSGEKSGSEDGISWDKREKELKEDWNENETFELIVLDLKIGERKEKYAVLSRKK